MNKRIQLFLFLLLSIIVPVVVFRNLLPVFSSSFVDINDYPLLAFIHKTNIQHILSFDITHVYQSNMFYPNMDTLLFSELLLPSSMLGALIFFFSKNIFIVMNLLFISSFFLNTIAAYVFWKHFFKGKAGYILAFLTAYSPFVFLNISHLQMIILWPFLLSLSYLFKGIERKRNAVFFGLFFGLSILSSVYVAIFLAFISVVFIVFRFLQSKKDNKRFLISLALSIFICLFVSSSTLFSYTKVKTSHKVSVRDEELAQYSGDPLGYVFTSRYQSVVSKSFPLNLFNKLDKTSGKLGFPGFSLIVLSFIGMYWAYNMRLVKTKQYKSIAILFMVLLICGLVFSLGTRLTLNGEYKWLPLPYYFIVKLIYPFTLIREPNRWSLLFYFFLLYFVGMGLESIKKRKLVVFFFLMLYILEIVPVSWNPSKTLILSSSYDTLSSYCKNNNSSVLLEYPMTYNKKDSSPDKKAQYWSSIVFASTLHNCKMVNGYSGFFPESFTQTEKQLNESLSQNDKHTFFRTLANVNVSIVKVNMGLLDEVDKQKIQSFFHNDTYTDVLYKDMDIVIFAKPI